MAESKYFPDLQNGVDVADVEQVENAFTMIEADMNGKVDKVSGKGLSANDFTDDYKTKLEGIAENAEVNVQSDWNETDTAKDAYIHNKPSIYTRAESDNRYLPQDTAAGTEPQTEYALAANAINYQVYGNSVQDGTPTPETPVEIQSVGDLVTSGEYAGKYDVPVTVRGKNLLHSNVTTLTSGGVTLTYDNGVITLNGTCTTSVNFELFNIALSANTYTLSANANKVPVNNTYAFVQLYDGKNNQIIQIENGNAQGYATVTTSVDGTFAYRVRADAGCVYNNVILKPQLEIGSTATAYEPYRAETKHYYLDEPLRKMFEVDGIGAQYADYIDYEKQKVIRVIKELICNGDGSIAWFVGNKMTNTVSFSMNPKDSISRTGELNCNKFTTRGSGISSVDAEFVQQSGVWLYVKINKSRLSGETSADFNAWLAENNLKLYYPLATPIEEPLTLAPMPLGAGTNNITTGTAVKPSNVIVDYYQNPTDVINSLKAAIVAMQSQTE